MSLYSFVSIYFPTTYILLKLLGDLYLLIHFQMIQYSLKRQQSPGIVSERRQFFLKFDLKNGRGKETKCQNFFFKAFLA